MPLLIGIDVGTSALKAIAVESDDGHVRASAVRPYPLYTDAPGFAEQDGEDFASAAFDALADLRTRVGAAWDEVRAIGLTGQMHSAMLLDANQSLVRRAILWCDTRTSAQCRAIEARVGLDGLRSTVRNLALEGFTVPKLLWVREHEPQLFARVRTVLMPKDYVALKLTGVLGTDVTDASGTLAFDPQARVWSTEFLHALDLDPSLFPQVRESQQVVGTVRREVADRIGTREVPVVAGSADNAAGAVGLGVVRDGRAMASIGTSGVVLAHTSHVRIDPGMRLHAFCAAVPGESYLMGVMLSAGASLRWFRDTHGYNTYDEVVGDAMRAPPGAGGVVFLPYLAGERTPHNDANARGAFVGLSLATGRAELARAVLEGIAFGLDDSLQLFRALDPPVALEQLRLTGGGASSAGWREILTDVFGVATALTNSNEGPAYGAALLAGVGAGIDPSVLAIADRCVRVVGEREPSRERHALYQERAAVYRALYGDLRARFADLRVGQTP